MLLRQQPRLGHDEPRTMTPAASILVVDDEVDTCRNLSDILTDLGYEVDMAHDGPTALKMVEHHPYDVVLLDLRMPGMDGLSVYREIKKLRAGTVAIIVTAYATSETAAEALNAGAWHVLPKPVDFPQLLRLVEEAAGQPLVMLVDDDRELCESLWDVLRSVGYRACVAHDEQAATERLRERAYQVLLLDLKLSSGDGRRVFDLVRSSDPKVGTVLITGFRTEMQRSIQKMLAEGADAVCYKPFNIPELLRTLERLSR